MVSLNQLAASSQLASAVAKTLGLDAERIAASGQRGKHGTKALAAGSRSRVLDASHGAPALPRRGREARRPFHVVSTTSDHEGAEALHPGRTLQVHHGCKNVSHETGREKPMQKMTMPQAFDEWMRKQKEDPDGFESTAASQAAHDRMAEDRLASEYGNACSGLLRRLMQHGASAWKTDAELEAAGIHP
jgi:hypothetical protein